MSERRAVQQMTVREAADEARKQLNTSGTLDSRLARIILGDQRKSVTLPVLKAAAERLGWSPCSER